MRLFLFSFQIPKPDLARWTPALPPLPPPGILRAFKRQTPPPGSIVLPMHWIAPAEKDTAIDTLEKLGQLKFEMEAVQAAMEAHSGPFRVSDIPRACPSVSLDMIRQVWKNLRGAKVECLGRGQSAQWRMRSNG